VDALTSESGIPAPAAPQSPGPVCAACGGEAVVHWQRRPTDDELAEVVAVEKDRRAEIRLLADRQMAAPEFGPLPTADGMTRTVYACGAHAIVLEAASRTHLSSCTAPNDADLPGCDCTPEPLPERPLEPDDEEPAASRLPAHWVTGGA
jgi:hypothetical protein